MAQLPSGSPVNQWLTTLARTPVLDTGRARAASTMEHADVNGMLMQGTMPGEMAQTKLTSKHSARIKSRIHDEMTVEDVYIPVGTQGDDSENINIVGDRIRFFSELCERNEEYRRFNLIHGSLKSGGADDDSEEEINHNGAQQGQMTTPLTEEDLGRGPG